MSWTCLTCSEAVPVVLATCAFLCHKGQSKLLAGGRGRPDFVIDSTFDLFVDLGANDEQCDFPVVYASGANGVAGGSPEELAEDLAPLFEAIVREARPMHPPCMHAF